MCRNKYRILFERIVLLVILIVGFSACTTGNPGQPETAIPPSTATGTQSPTFTPTETPVPSATSTVTPIPQVSLAAVGDLMLARTIGERVQAEGPQVIFAGVQPIFDMADILVGNLECAITERGQPQPKGYTFRAPLDAVHSLQLAGFDLLTLANNHAMDYGAEGLQDTQALLAQAGMAYTGTGSNEAEARAPVILVKNGLRMAFLGYVDVPVEVRGFDTRAWIATPSEPGVAWADPGNIATDVAAAKLQSDVVIVMLHSGYEGVVEPNTIQRQAARAAIDAGATLVIGAHPHVLQPVEWYNGGLIAYSLGNFVFDDFGLELNRTAILFVTLGKDGIQDYNWIPVIIDNGLPRLASGEDARIILEMVSP